MMSVSVSVVRLWTPSKRASVVELDSVIAITVDFSEHVGDRPSHAPPRAMSVAHKLAVLATDWRSVYSSRSVFAYRTGHFEGTLQAEYQT